MGYTQFLAWVGKQGLKIPGLQKYLYKAWKEAEKVGTPIVEKNFPRLLTKAKDFYKNFKTFDPKVVSKTKITPDKVKGKSPLQREISERTGKVFDPKTDQYVTPGKVTKIPTSYKTPPVQPKRIPLFANPTSQEAMIFFREYGKKQQGIYGPFGRGTDGFRNMMQWVGVNSPKEVMKVMKQYGYKPKVVPKADGGSIDKSLPGRSRDI